MTTEEALQVLIAHNEWRRFKGGPDEIGPAMIEPRIVGVAIDTVVAALERIIPAAEDVIEYWDSPTTYIETLRQAVREPT